MKQLTLASLFDGIGGFPLCAVRNGVTPVWASEIEPFPIMVTRKRFPQMAHLGNVSKICGADVPPVDIITFGSPCQDLSVAGKQAGIHDGARSSLFFEAIRIIKEMRANAKADIGADEPVRPRWAVWENVPGAYSSHGGRDFQAVLQALASVKDPDAVVPLPPKGKWQNAGCIVGDGYSIAWRTYDAQYWPGTPQRRKRIYLVADFDGERAGEILFEREGRAGHPEPGKAAREGTAADFAGSPVADDQAGNCLNPWDYQTKRCYSVDGIFPTLQAGERSGQNQQSVCITVGGNDRGLNDVTVYGFDHAITTGGNCTVQGQCAYDNIQRTQKKSGVHAVVYDTTQCTSPLNYSNPQPGDPCHTLAAQQHPPLLAREEKYLFENHSQDSRYTGPLEICPVLSAQLGTGGNNQPFIVKNEPVYCLQGNGIDRADTAGCNGKGWKDDGKSYTLDTIDRHAVVYATKGNTVGTLCARDCKGVGSQYVEEGKVVVVARDNGNGKIAPTVTGDHNNRVTDYTAICVGNGQANQLDMGNRAGALNCMHDQQIVIHNAKPPRRYIARRLTPLECCRLQGYPDGWTEDMSIPEPSEEEISFWTAVWAEWAEINGKTPKSRNGVIKWLQNAGSDSAEYKAYGNSLAIPCANDVIRRIAGFARRE